MTWGSRRSYRDVGSVTLFISKVAAVCENCLLSNSPNPTKSLRNPKSHPPTSRHYSQPAAPAQLCLCAALKRESRVIGKGGLLTLRDIQRFGLWAGDSVQYGDAAEFVQTQLEPLLLMPAAENKGEKYVFS